MAQAYILGRSAQGDWNPIAHRNYRAAFSNCSETDNFSRAVAIVYQANDLRPANIQ
jgi:hypothetical protein